MPETRKKSQIKFYLAAVIILLVFLHYFRAISPVEDYLLEMSGNSQNSVYTFLAKLKYSFVNYQEAQDLKKEAADQKSQINQLLYQISQLKSLETENSRLSQLLNFSKDKEFSLATAKVISRDFYRANTLIINKGKIDGIEEGFPVVVDDGVIIGKIIDAKENTSTVLLLTDQASKLAVSTQDSNKTMGLANGDFGLSIKVESIPQNSVLKEGDILITSGLENDVPRGLIVGSVNRIIGYENELFKSATISPAADYGEVFILSVVIPKKIIQ